VGEKYWYGPIPLPPPSPSFSLPSPSVHPIPLPQTARGSGQLPQHGRRQSPGLKRMCVEPRKCFWWQQNCFYVWQSLERSGSMVSSLQKKCWYATLANTVPFRALIDLLLSCFDLKSYIRAVNFIL